MKSVLISLLPQWCEKIFNGKKKIEVRKDKPLQIQTPFEVQVYCSKGKSYLYKNPNTGELFLDGNGSYRGGDYEGRYLTGKVIGEFVCDRITCCQAYYGESGEKHLTNLFGCDVKNTCLTEHEMFDYIIGKDKKEGTGWLWHITEPKLFDKPKDITEFALYGKCADECSEYDFCARDNEDDRVRNECFKSTFLKRPPQSWCYVEEKNNEVVQESERGF